MAPASWKIDWHDDMSVGIPEVDEGHRQLIRSVNDLNLAISGRMELAEIQRRMRSMLDEAEQHFAHEEALLAQWNYPGVDDHASKHIAIRKALHKVVAQCTQDSLEPHWIAAALEVKDILVDHLLTEDVKYRSIFAGVDAGCGVRRTYLDGIG